jgi:glycosyltransferase involved in cell wall biosynthesis
MRILHCIPSMAGGGAERQLTYLAAGLVQRGVHTHVALVRRGEHFQELERSGAKVHQLAASGNHSPALALIIHRLIQRLQPDVIQTWLTQMDIVAGIVARFNRVPWILSERNSAPSYARSWKNRLREWLGREASAVIANSQSGSDYWGKHLPSRVPRVVISNALPLDSIDETLPLHPATCGVGPGEKLVLYVGRLHFTKNLPTLLHALKRVTGELPIKAVLCGEGPERAALEQAIANLGLAGRVRLQGYVSDPWQWMKRADVFVSPSFVEGHPNTVMEAMACGVPLVVSDIPAHREFLDEHTARLIDPNAPDRFAQAILGALKSPEAARGRTVLARKRSQAWSVDTMTVQHLAAYSHVLRSAGREASRSPVVSGHQRLVSTQPDRSLAS